MQIKEFNLKDYDNAVAIAVRKIGGVKKAAKKLDTAECVVELAVKRGYVGMKRHAVILENHTDVPVEDLLRRPE